ncbi:MAG: diversity-generating retroelement protein Avd [Candidatus Pacebacteria bacterium]|nr:diversity-generating retroelement protein Avd [Candidatus Paceibacterota bacterium]MDD5752995.1 diversity-generating retroelement protein Avd [Candidatus Paceibacterota bacterium]
MARYNDLVVFQKAYDLALWLHPVVGRFPKNQRFVLGEQIENEMINILTEMIEANKESGMKRGEKLKQISIDLDKLMVLFRMAKDLKFINIKRYGFFAEKTVEIGNLLGGWQKTLI